MSNPGYTSKIFNVIRQMAGRDGLKLARSLEKDTYKLEAHHRHLRFTHQFQIAHTHTSRLVSIYMYII